MVLFRGQDLEYVQNGKR